MSQYTYNSASRREDLLGMLTNIDPTETQFTTGVQKNKATNTLHEWPTDTLPTVGDNANAEGSDAPADAGTDPTRLQNITQIFLRTAKVSGTEMEVDHAGFDSRMALEVDKEMKKIKNDMEYAFIRGSIASGLPSSSSNAANSRRLKGVKNWITTNTSHHSGATFTEAILNDYFQLSWNNGGKVNAIYTPMSGKRRISSFTAGATKNVDAKDRRLVNAVDVYESDAAGVTMLFPHRYLTIAGDYVGASSATSFDVLGLQEDTWAISFLRPLSTKDLARNGDYERKMLTAEATIEARAQQANFLIKAVQ
jgi:hypothetical protein